MADDAPALENRAACVATASRRGPGPHTARHAHGGMPKLTLLSRISDGLPLAASMEDEKDHRELDGYKAQAKKLLKTMNNGAPARVSVESGSSVFQCAPARPN